MKLLKLESNISLFITYNQISVFQSDLENPFNNWTDEYVKQGFSWRKGSISFRTLDDSVEMYIHIKKSKKIEIYDNALRSIAVPFFVNSGELVEISVINDSHSLKLSNGEYLLLFQTGKCNTDDSNWCEFCFIETSDLEPKILKADPDIKVLKKYKMDAKPA